MPHLDTASLRMDSQVAGNAGGTAVHIQHGMEQGVLTGAVRPQPVRVVFQVVKRAIGKIGPVAPGLVLPVGFEKRFGLGVRVKVHHGAMLSPHRGRRGMRPWQLVRNREANRLAKGINVFRHGFSGRYMDDFMGNYIQ